MIVAVQPIGSVDRSSLDETAACLREQFGVEPRVLAPQPGPVYAHDGKRRQYNSFEIMRTLARSVPEGAARILGVTECDLFIPALTFVFGQAQLNAPVALVSFARLRQSFYGLPDDENVFRLRLRKEVMHEIGHTLGLIHCPDLGCTMRLSTGIVHVDAKEARFCEQCEVAVQAAIARWRLENNEIAVADPGR